MVKEKISAELLIWKVIEKLANVQMKSWAQVTHVEEVRSDDPMKKDHHFQVESHKNLQQSICKAQKTVFSRRTELFTGEGEDE